MNFSWWLIANFEEFFAMQSILLIHYLYWATQTQKILSFLQNLKDEVFVLLQGAINFVTNHFNVFLNIKM